MVDESAAEVIREIFKLCIAGYGPAQIARILEERKIEAPVAHARTIGIIIPIANGFHSDNPYNWSPDCVANILDRAEYTGKLINFKTCTKSYKNHKVCYNSPENLKIFDDHHEAIVDENTFVTVQNIRKGRRVVNRLGEMPILSDMVYCADCGAKLYQVRGKGLSHEKEYMVGSSYRKKSKSACTSHQIRNVVLEKLILAKLQEVVAFVQDSEQEFIEMVTKQSKYAVARKLKESKKEYETAMARYSKLDNLIQHLYEDNVEGKISDERFTKLTATYEQEQASLKVRIAELDSFISDESTKLLNADMFIHHFKKYTKINELSCEVIRELISKVIVHKAEVIDGKRTQAIDIIFNGLEDIEKA